MDFQLEDMQKHLEYLVEEVEFDWINAHMEPDVLLEDGLRFKETFEKFKA